MQSILFFLSKPLRIERKKRNPLHLFFSYSQKRRHTILESCYIGKQQQQPKKDFCALLLISSGSTELAIVETIKFMFAFLLPAMAILIKRGASRRRRRRPDGRTCGLLSHCVFHSFPNGPSDPVDSSYIHCAILSNTLNILPQSKSKITQHLKNKNQYDLTQWLHYKRALTTNVRTTHTGMTISV